MFACFPRPGWHLLVWVACLPILLALVTERSLARAFLWGYVCGALFLAGSCYWFVEVMEKYGKVAPALAAGVLLLFVAVFSGFFGAFGLAEGWVARRMPLAALALSPFLWVSMERRPGGGFASACLGDGGLWAIFPRGRHKRYGGMGAS